VRLQGIVTFAEAKPRASEAGQKITAQVLSHLQGKGPCGKEASLLT